MVSAILNNKILSTIAALSKRSVYTYLLSIMIFLLFFITPFINNSSLANSSISSKSIFFLFSLSILVVIVVLSHGFKKVVPLQFKVSTVDTLGILLLFYILCNRYFFHDYQGFSFRFLDLLGLSVLYCVLRLLPVGHFLYLFIAVIVSCIGQAIYGLLQLFNLASNNNTIFPVTGSFINPGPFAGYLAISAIISIIIYLYQQELLRCVELEQEIKFKQNLKTVLGRLSTLGISITIIILAVSRSKAAWLAFLLGFSFLFVYKKFHVIKNFLLQQSKYSFLNKVFLSFVFLTLLLLALFSVKLDSSKGRLLIWQVTASLVKESPFFGVGFDRFNAYYMPSQAAYLSKSKSMSEAYLADNSNYAFNDLLQFIMEQGFIGFLLLVTLVFLCINVKVNPVNGFFKTGALGVILSVFVFSLFSYPMQILPIKMLLVMAVSLLANQDVEFTVVVVKPLTINNKLIFVVRSTYLGIVLLIFFYVCTNTIAMRNAFIYWKRGLVKYDQDLYEDSLIEYEAAYPVLKQNGDFLMSYGKALAMAKQSQKSLNLLKQALYFTDNTIIETTLGDVYKKLGRYKAAELSYIKAEQMVPNRFYPEYLLAKLYYDSGQKSEAYRKAKEILSKQVKIPSNAIQEMKAEMKLMLLKSSGLNTYCKLPDN